MGPYDKRNSRQAFEALADAHVPSWCESLRRCLGDSKNDPTSRYAALANVDASGFPQVRHVVMRGCLGDFGHDADAFESIGFWMVTDRRSAKFDDLTANPAAEIAWYFREAREQFRIAGTVTLLTAPDSILRRSAYAMLSPAAKVQFFWPDPGQPRRPEQDVSFQVSLDPASEAEPTENFAVMILSPWRVDHLVLDGSPQNRRIHELDPAAGWRSLEVNP